MLESSTPTVSRGLLWTALLLGAAVAAYVVYSGISSRTTDAKLLKEQAQTQSVRTVTVIAPVPANATPTLDLPGRIEAFSKAPIYARISGYLKS